MKTKVTGLVLAITMVLSMGLTGCQKETKKETKDAVKTEATPTATPAVPADIQFWTMQLSPTFDAYLNGAVDKFQKENTNIKVKWVDVPWGDMEKKILAAAASNAMPDVANLNPHFAQQLAQLGALSDMDKLASDVKAGYFAGAWEASQYNGKTFGLPWYLTTGITYYNKDLFKKAGLDAEKPPVTFDDMYKAAKQIKEKTGKYGYMPVLSQQQGMEDFEKMGIRLFNADFTKATYTAKESIEAVNFYKKMLDEGLIPRESLTEGTGKAIQMYSTGEVAIFQGGTSHAGMIEKNSAEVYANTGVGQQLLNKDGKVNVAVMNVTVSEKTKFKDAAVKFAKFITNAPNQVEFAKTSGAIIPSTKESIKDDFFTKGGAKPADIARKVSAEQIDKSRVIFPPIKNWNDVYKPFLNGVAKAVSGAAKAEDAMKEAETAANSALSK